MMSVDTLLAQVAFALLGGISAEILHWYGLSRRPGALPKYSKAPIYWITTLGMVAVGGIMPALYINGTASALLCFHLGAATPVTLQKVIAAAPKAVTTLGPEETSMTDFFRW
ncbi:hypothetical protein [Sphingomonas sp.]|uniref:hypothetical protein n=1 Tax=Sphingomonas sp. TaxID=28214 RepID=UPI002DD6AECB|nr:hypothetical protein [Sphingomonas sp.]